MYILVLPKINPEKYLIIIYMKIIIILLLLVIISAIISSSREPFMNPSSYSTSYPPSYVLPSDESVTLKSSCGNGYSLGLDKQCYRCPNNTQMLQTAYTPSGYYCHGATNTQPLKSSKY